MFRTAVTEARDQLISWWINPKPPKFSMSARRQSSVPSVSAAKLGIEAQNHAAEIKIRAERKAGELLGKLERSEGGRPEKTPDRVSAVSDYRAAIEDADVTERQAQRWQQVATGFIRLRWLWWVQLKSSLRKDNCTCLRGQPLVEKC